MLAPGGPLGSEMVSAAAGKTCNVIEPSALASPSGFGVKSTG
jgi:hypothetical protein